MPRKLSLQTTLGRRTARISIKSHPYRRVALTIARKKGILANLVDYCRPISVEGRAVSVGKNILARSGSENETEDEKSFSGSSLLLSNVAKTNVLTEIDRF